MARDRGGAGTAAVLQSSFWKITGFKTKFTKTLAKYGEEETSGYLANLGNVPPRETLQTEVLMMN